MRVGSGTSGGVGFFQFHVAPSASAWGKRPGLRLRAHATGLVGEGFEQTVRACMASPFCIEEIRIDRETIVVTFGKRLRPGK